MGTKEGKLLAEATELKSLVSYAEGSIVSKTVIEKKVGTVTLFAFSSGQGLSEHSAPFDAMITVIDGEGVIIIGGTPHTLQSGQAIIMPANIPHAVKAEKAFKMQLVMIRS